MLDCYVDFKNFTTDELARGAHGMIVPLAWGNIVLISLLI